MFHMHIWNQGLAEIFVYGSVLRVIWMLFSLALASYCLTNCFDILNVLLTFSCAFFCDVSVHIGTNDLRRRSNRSFIALFHNIGIMSCRIVEIHEVNHFCLIPTFLCKLKSTRLFVTSFAVVSVLIAAILAWRFALGASACWILAEFIWSWSSRSYLRHGFVTNAFGKCLILLFNLSWHHIVLSLLFNSFDIVFVEDSFVGLSSFSWHLVMVRSNDKTAALVNCASMV